MYKNTEFVYFFFSLLYFPPFIYGPAAAIAAHAFIIITGDEIAKRQERMIPYNIYYTGTTHTTIDQHTTPHPFFFVFFFVIFSTYGFFFSPGFRGLEHDTGPRDEIDSPVGFADGDDPAAAG